MTNRTVALWLLACCLAYAYGIAVLVRGIRQAVGG